MKPDISQLTLREKIGQTAIFALHRIKNIPDLKDFFTNNPMGCIWSETHTKEIYQNHTGYLNNPNLEGRKEDLYIDFLNFINSCMRIPTIPVTDASTGIGRIFEGHATFPTSSSLGAAKDPIYSYDYAKLLGKDLHAMGIRWLWRPVGDNGGTFVDSRNLSSDHEQNGKLLAAFIHGLHDAGIASGSKHFPGQDPYDRRDSHFCTASYSQSLEYWFETQGKEFQACIDAGTASIMVGHHTFRAVDDTCVNGAMLPCTLSHKVITGLLKERMGFQGVVLTDDVGMKGLTSIYPPEKLYVELLKAGIDMVLSVNADYIDIVEAAVRNGQLEESRIDDACQRVLAMKERFGLFNQTQIPHPSADYQEQIISDIHALNEKIAANSLTMTANRTGFIPVDPTKIRKVKIVYIGYSDPCYANLKYAVEEFARHGAQCDLQRGFQKEDNDTLDQYDLIIYATYIGMHAPAGGQAFFGQECHMMRQIMTVGVEKSVGVSFGNPDIFFNYFTAAPTFVNCYSTNPETITAFVRGLYGEIQFTDYAPFPLNPITRTNDVYA